MSYQFRGGGMWDAIPTVTKNLLIINVLMLLIKSVAAQTGLDLDNILGMHHYMSPKFMPHQLVTHIFMHGGILHLFLNMFGLFMFGRTLESVWGPKRFLTFYMLCGLGAANIHIGINTYSINAAETEIYTALDHAQEDDFEFNRVIQKYIGYVDPREYDVSRSMSYPDIADMLFHSFRDLDLVGASGSVVGLVAGFGMLFPNTLLMLIFFPVPVKAKYLISIYMVYEFGMGILNLAGITRDGIAHFAHLGGALVGWLVIMYWRKNSSSFY